MPSSITMLVLLIAILWSNLFRRFCTVTVAIGLLFLDGSESDAAQQVFAHGEGEERDRNQEDHRAGRDLAPVGAAVAGTRNDRGRRGERVSRREYLGEGEFVPGRDKAEYRCGGDPCEGLRQRDLPEGAQPRIAVEQGCVVVFVRDVVEEP